MSTKVEELVEEPKKEVEETKENNGETTSKSINKRKRKEKEPKTPIKRTITSKSLRKFTEKELRDGLKYLIDSGHVPQRPELGNISKLNKDALIKYCKPWATANYYRAIVKQREIREKNAPVFTEKQRRIVKKLNKYSVKNIMTCTNNLKVKIKNGYGMKKEELNEAIALSEHGIDILHAVRELEKKQEEEREKVRLEKEMQKQKEKQESSEEEESPPKKKMSKKMDISSSDDDSSESEQEHSHRKRDRSH